MKTQMARWACTLAVAATVFFAAAAAPERHMALVKAEPGADSTVTVAPTALKLYWTQVPKLPATQVRLTNAATQAVQVGPVTLDARDTKVMNVPITAQITPGVYTVTWRTAGDDGHILNGTYKFTFRPAR
jgi:methionine-rich copper-binding protein CopC